MRLRQEHGWEDARLTDKQARKKQKNKYSCWMTFHHIELNSAMRQ
jgi:hypothetical protein